MIRSMLVAASMIASTVCAEIARDARIYVAGHTGLVGSAIVRHLQELNYTHIITCEHTQLDLRNAQSVNQFFATQHPEYVILAAAKVGGILANHDYPAEFVYDNIMIAAHVIDAAYRHNVKKLLFLGSSCIYPRDCPQPIKEEYLLTGQLEWTNAPYAVAKIAGITLCQSYNRQYGTKFICCMPTNLYGPYDNFDLSSSHALPALLRKVYEAKQRSDEHVVVWGSGRPYREFLYVDDLADACIFLLNHYEGNDIVNVGTGSDVTIEQLVDLIKTEVGFDGKVLWDSSKPDGTPRKLLNVERLTNLGWKARTNLQAGIKQTLQWCLQHNIFEQ